jgi:hypothetical protein
LTSGSFSKSKRALRRNLASRPVAEKLDLLDVLRDRARTIREAAGRKERTVTPESPGRAKGK